jgi:chitin disaccharide deacetylase
MIRQLIVNADDFGLTERVSRGILDAHRAGIVTSATIMANGRAFDITVCLSRRAPQLGIGVHLNLTEGAPVSPPWRIPTLVNRERRLHLSPGRLLRGILTRHVDLAEAEIELRAQLEKVCRAGIAPTHLDAHKHVHILPGVSEIVIRLAQQFSVRRIRCPREAAPEWPTLLRRGGTSRAVAVRQYPTEQTVSAEGRAPLTPTTAVVQQYLVGRAVSGFSLRFREKLAEAGLLSPAHFYGLSQTGFLDGPILQDILGRLPEGVSELMCHPGYVDADLVKTGTRLLAQRQVEIQALTAPTVRKLVAERGIQLVSYRQLGPPVQESGIAA